VNVVLSNFPAVTYLLGECYLGSGLLSDKFDGEERSYPEVSS
jgi:hypothetical protein